MVRGWCSSEEAGNTDSRLHTPIDETNEPLNTYTHTNTDKQIATDAQGGHLYWSVARTGIGLTCDTTESDISGSGYREGHIPPVWSGSRPGSAKSADINTCQTDRTAGRGTSHGSCKDGGITSKRVAGNSSIN